MERLLNMLRTIHPLSSDLEQFLKDRLKSKEIRRKHFLLKAGHVCRQICFIDSGLFRCFYVHRDHEVSSWFMKEGDVILSIESFFQQRPSYESIQAVEDCTVFFIEYNELQYIYRTYPEFNFVGRVLLEGYYQLWAQQLYALRMKTGMERYAWLLANHNELTQRIPAKYIASWLGINEQHFSIIKSRR